MPVPSPDPASSHRFPRPPPYAWGWLQRTRPVLVEAAARLTGAAPTPRFVDDLRARFEADPFTRDVVVGVVADVAFGGRVPRRRPAGSSWDRGLTWWAAALAGVTPAEFDNRSDGPETPRLFAVGDEPDGAVVRSETGDAPTRPTPSADRAVVVAGLRQLLAGADGDVVPVSAVRALLEQLGADQR